MELGGHTELLSRFSASRLFRERVCVTSYKAYQADTKLRRARNNEEVLRLAHDLGFCAIDEYAISAPVLQSARSYNFDGKDGFSYHWWYDCDRGRLCGAVEEMAI